MNFRPISLCNMVNKIFSKMLASRVGLILNKIISHSQSGFVGEKIITDNILLAQEMAYSLDSKCKDGNMMIKLDMAKAHDRVNWRFLYVVLHKMNPPKLYSFYQKLQ